MPVNDIITNVTTELFRYLSSSQIWFTKNQLPSITYGIALLVIQTGNLLEECIEKEKPFLYKKSKINYDNINIELIISNLFHDIPLQSTVNEAAVKVINTSVLLKKILEYENNILFKNGGDVSYEDRELTFILFRGGKRRYYKFPNQFTQVLWTNSKEKLERLKLNKSPDQDGLTYYLQASPYIWDLEPVAIQLSKKEALFLARQLDSVIFKN
jgi:hypothetical protein